MRTTTIVAALLATFAATTAAAQTQLTPYTSPDGSFTVAFPGAPTVSAPAPVTNVDGSSSTLRIYATQTANAEYMVTVIDHRSNLPDNYLATFLKASATGCGGTSAETSAESYHGHPSAIVQVNCSTGMGLPRIILERMVIVGKRLYVLSYGATSANSTQCSQFLNSLHIN